MDAGASERSQFDLPGEELPRPESALFGRQLRRRSIAERLHPLSLLLTEELERGTAFLFTPVFMAAGALAYYALPWEPQWAMLLCALAIACAAAWFARLRAGLLYPVLALVFLMLGAVAAKVEVARSATQMNGSEVATRVTGTVVALQALPTGRTRIVLDVVSTERPTLRYAPERVRLTARGVPENLRPGDALEGVARLMPLSGPVRPGGYDFAFHSYFDGIGAVGFYYYDPETVELVGEAPGLRVAAARWIEGLRMEIAARVRATLQGAEAEVAATLIAGVRSGIPEEIAEAMRRTGLAHVLSISGLHMALVAATVLLGFRAIFGLMPIFSSRYPVRKFAAGGALVACAFYLGISGAEVAAQRSFVMIAVMLTALLFDREALSLRNLAISALVVIALRPHEVTGPSFQMSFAATAALIGAYGLWRDRRRSETYAAPTELPRMLRILRTMALYMLGLAMTSIVAGLATTIFGAYHFNRVSPWSLPANLVAMPAVSVIVMPFAVLSTLAMPFGLEGPFLTVMGWGVAYVNAVAVWFSDRTTLDAVGALPGSAVIAFTIALLLIALPATRLRWAAMPFAIIGAVLRPNAFTVQNWIFATGAGELAGPGAATAEPSNPENAFACADRVCVVSVPEIGTIVHAETAQDAVEWCGRVVMIVIEHASTPSPCVDQTLVLTGRDLARRGSAEIRFDAGGRPTLSHAIIEPYRPWHAHRAFSREARGMPPYERPARDTPSVDNPRDE